MYITVDGGGFCAPADQRFGNFIVTENLIRSLMRNDTGNSYTVYSFCRYKPYDFDKKWNYNVFGPLTLWMKVRVSIEEIMKPGQIFLALNQAIPLWTKADIISFSHGLSFYHFPHLYREGYIRFIQQFNATVRRSRYIIVSSKRVLKEFRQVYPSFHNIHVLPFGIPEDMLAFNTQYIRKPKKYFLYVGMDHPIKNIRNLIRIFDRFRKQTGCASYKLFLVGIYHTRKYRHQNVVTLPHTTNRSQLAKLYSEATAYVSASLYESGNIPVLEALSFKCPVIGMRSAIIPEMDEFVSTAENSEEFLDMMRQAAAGNSTEIDRAKLTKKFSWNGYAKKLMKIYSLRS